MAKGWLLQADSRKHGQCYSIHCECFERIEENKAQEALRFFAPYAMNENKMKKGRVKKDMYDLSTKEGVIQYCEAQVARLVEQLRKETLEKIEKELPEAQPETREKIKQDIQEQIEKMLQETHEHLEKMKQETRD